MLERIEVLCHSSIVIRKDKVIYFDPFKIENSYNDADIIFITHSHYDHFSPEDINKVRNKDTVIVLTKDLRENAIKLGFLEEKIIEVVPNKSYIVEGLEVHTIPAYNIDKDFHRKENDFVGYIITIGNIRYYIAGDTDINEDNKRVKCDVAFLPVRRNIYYGL